jgi:predicted MFS family arabinose efflux permease
LSAIPARPIAARAEQRSTRLQFFIAGFAAAAWASLVPFAKARTGLDEAALGLALLCLGAGSILGMPIAGVLSTRYGCRVVLTVSSALLCATLPLLAILSSVPWLATTLFFFGVALGSTDCVVNVQAVIVERAGDKPMMSGFHGFFSLGGIVGAAGTSVLLTLNMSALASTLVAVATIVIALSMAYPALLPYGNPAEGPPFAIPHGIVLFIGVLCFIVFLVEGSMLDWSAIFLTEQRGMPSAQAGFGFASFSLAMTLGRLAGDTIVATIGRRAVLARGSLLAAGGIVIAVTAPWWEVELVGYAMVGLGCSNIAPVLYTAAGRQTTQPQAVAIPAITTLGYAGVLAGPAGIGFIAQHSSLATAFFLVAALMVAVAASSRLLRI